MIADAIDRGARIIRSEPLRYCAALLVPLVLAVLLSGCDRGPAPKKILADVPPISFERASADDVRHGERLARVLGCIGCHGEDLTGQDWSEPGFGTLWTANLTRAAARMNDSQFARTMNSGRRPDGRELWEMPSHLFTHVGARDLWPLLAFIRSRPVSGPERPPPSFEPAARREIAQGLFKSSAVQVSEQGSAWPPQAPGGHVLARHIVRATCAECHRMNLGGGQPNPEAAPRPDLKVVVSAYERADFRRLMRTGRGAGDRELGLMGEVARGRYRHLTDGEVDAIYDYLRALGGVS